MIKPKLLIRIAAGLIFFFAFGHSMGHFTRHDVDDPKATEVLRKMNDNTFDLFGHMTNYEGMYTGSSLNLIFTLLVFTMILWHISSISTENKKLAMKLLLPITICIFGFSITSFMYFFLVPGITCLLAGLISMFAIIKLNSQKEKNV